MMPLLIDDIQIPDSMVLLRRIHPLHFVLDGNTGMKRISSAAFNDVELSILFQHLLEAGGRTLRNALQNHPTYGLASLSAGDARDCTPKQGVCYDPTPDEPAHGLVFGKKTNAVKKNLVKRAVVAIPTGDTKAP